MSAILVLKHMPTCCADCPFIEYIDKDNYKCSKYHETLNSIDWLDTHLNNNIMERRTEWCPLNPMNDKAVKIGDKDFVIYQRDYLMENLDREIELLKKAKLFEEYMRSKDERSINS